MVRTVAPALALLAACFSPEPRPGAPCAAGERCPDPLVCIAGTCRLPGPPGPPGDAPILPDGAPVQCPSPYARMPSGACHLERSAPAEWLEAELDCEARGGHLAVPDSAAEAMELRDPRWIGVNDRLLEGTFLAVTGVPVSFTFWAPGEPSGGLTDCVHSGFQARWRTGPCDFPFPYVCEYDGLPAVPGTY